MFKSNKEVIIHVVDCDEVFEFLHAMLSCLGFTVVNYPNLQTFLGKKTLIPGCLLIDIETPNYDFSMLKESLQIEGFATLPIIYTSFIDDINLAVYFMKNGATDFLLKPFNEEILIDSINRALHINKANIEKIQEIFQTRQKYLGLSKREKQILQGIVAGKSSKIISQEIAISLKTVEAHRASMMKKMNIKSVSKLVMLFHCVSQNKHLLAL